MNRELRVIASAERVCARIAELAAEIAADHRSEGAGDPLFIVIAEGACRFAEMLQQEVAACGLQTAALVVRARRTDGQVLRPVQVEDFEPARCRDRDVIVVDDIADEGRTLEAVLALVTAAASRRVRTAVLVSKHARRRVALTLDYVGFEVEDGWIVGFGMDLDGELRELDHLAVVEPG